MHEYQLKVIVEESHKASICEAILRSLPNWFGIEQSILDYVEGVKAMPMWAYINEGEVVGFLSLKLHNRDAAEIYVIGNLPRFHRQGVGRALLNEAEHYLRRQNFRFLTVKTLSPSREDEFYAKTREFYQSMGFVAIEEFPSLWGPENPCWFMLKSL